MRRRTTVAEVGDGPPAELLRFAYAEWVDGSAPVPAHARHWTWPTWHHISAWRRFLNARHAWAVAAGVDYVETFRPEWVTPGRSSFSPAVPVAADSHTQKVSD